MKLGENGLNIVRRVLELLAQQGRYAEANALLHKLPEEDIASPELGRVAAGVTLAESATESNADSESARTRALALARKAIRSDSKNPRDYLWLGQIATLAGQPREAEKAFRQARQLAPSDPEPWVTLILFLARTDVKKAAAELAEAERQLPKDQAPLALGICCEALGRREEAEKHYGAALLRVHRR